MSPKWIHRPAGPIGSATAWTNAATSWFVTRSSSATSSGEGATARTLMASRSSGGIVPRRAQPSHASTSMRSQCESFVSSDHTAAISGSVYRGITAGIPPPASP